MILIYITFIMKVNKSTVVFDIETTGLDIINDRIIDISLIKINPDKTKSEKNYRVNLHD